MRVRLYDRIRSVPAKKGETRKYAVLIDEETAGLLERVLAREAEAAKETESE